jgi:hypothetical protein
MAAIYIELSAGRQCFKGMPGARIAACARNNAAAPVRRDGDQVADGRLDERELHVGATGESCGAGVSFAGRSALICRSESGGRPGGVRSFEFEGETPMTDIPYGAAPASAGERKSLFTRFLGALIDARTRQARREISLHLHLVPEDVAKRVRFELGRDHDRT